MMCEDLLVGESPVWVVPAVPPGYQLLPGGVTRRLRVNSRFLAGGVGELPWRVIEGGAAAMYEDVQVCGSSRCVTGFEPKKVSATVRDVPCAWVETEAPLVVR